MGRKFTILLGTATLAVAGCATAQSTTVRTPEGAEMKVITDLPRFPRPYERELPPLEPAK